MRHEIPFLTTATGNQIVVDDRNVNGIIDDNEKIFLQTADKKIKKEEDIQTALQEIGLTLEKLTGQKISTIVGYATSLHRAQGFARHGNPAFEASLTNTRKLAQEIGCNEFELIATIEQEGYRNTYNYFLTLAEESVSPKYQGDHYYGTLIDSALLYARKGNIDIDANRIDAIKKQGARVDCEQSLIVAKELANDSTVFFYITDMQIQSVRDYADKAGFTAQEKETLEAKIAEIQAIEPQATARRLDAALYGQLLPLSETFHEQTVDLMTNYDHNVELPINDLAWFCQQVEALAKRYSLLLSNMRDSQLSGDQIKTELTGIDDQLSDLALVSLGNQLSEQIDSAQERITANVARG